MLHTLTHLRLDRPLVVLDNETTGPDPRTDRVIEVAAILYRPGEQPSVLHHRVDPGVPIPPEATAVHGLRDADIAGCPPFGAVARGVLDFLAAADLAGYNLAFDLRVLSAEFARSGLAFDLTGRAAVDPMRVFHRREPRDLAAAVAFYLGRPHPAAHSALADAAAAAAVLDAQLARYPDLPRTPADLHRLLTPADLGGRFRPADGGLVFTFGKWAGRPLAEVAARDPAYLRWMLAADFLPDAKAAVRDALDRSTGR